MTWRSKLILAAMSTAVSLAAAEIAVRLTLQPHKKRLATYDPDLGWTGRPHGRGIYTRGVDDIRVPFQYNNVGFRDEDLLPKQCDAPRVALLGDSFLESLEVIYTSSFQFLLQTRLQRRLDPRSEIAVLGSQGYSTAQQLLAFRKYASLLSADVVLTMFYTGNDFEDNLRERFAFLDDHGRLVLPVNREPAWQTQLQLFKRWLFESSHLVFHLKNKLQPHAVDGTKRIVQRDERYTFELTEQLILRTRDEVEQTGARYGVVIVPSREEVGNPSPPATKAVLEICRRHGIACLDLSPYLSVGHYFEHDIHFNKAGHIVVARALFDFLASNNAFHKYHSS